MFDKLPENHLVVSNFFNNETISSVLTDVTDNKRLSTSKAIKLRCIFLKKLFLIILFMFIV
jgi:hypothetical protein